MGKGPILLLGAAAIAGIAIAVNRPSAATSTTTPATAPKGTSAKDLTASQKSKLEAWAKGKGIPVDQAYDIAKSIYGMKF